LTLAVIGLGFVGLSFALVAAKSGQKVIGVEADKKKYDTIRNGKVPFYEPKLENFLKETKDKTFEVTNDINYAVSNSDIIFLCVNTPENEDSSVNLTYLKTAAAQIGKSIKKGNNEFPVIVVKSTVPPQTTESLVKNTLEEFSLKKVGEEFGLAMVPEFMREGSAVNDIQNPHLVVIGTNDDKTDDRLTSLFESIYQNSKPPTLHTSIVNSELIKYVNNAFLATKISFINTIANICNNIPGANVETIAEAIGRDPRIGKLFLNAGPGYGGSCFPKDLSGFVNYSKSIGYNPLLLESTQQVNQTQPKKIIEIITKKSGELHGKQIAVLGISFKKDTDDIRQSPSIKIIHQLLELGANVKTHDPKALPNLKKIFSDKLVYCTDIAKCLKDTDLCVILTDWDEYQSLSADDFIKNMNEPRVFDTRRIINPEKMLTVDYFALGYGN